MLIEEAAGITKYKARKKQAEQKIEQTRQNLLRVGDIVSKIERALRPSTGRPRRPSGT